MLHKLWNTLNIPILGLVDADPHGMRPRHHTVSHAFITTECTYQQYPSWSTFRYIFLGIEILCVYKYGSQVCNKGLCVHSYLGAATHSMPSCVSQALSFDAQNLTVPVLKWLGVLPSDIERYD